MARGMVNGEPVVSQAQTKAWDEGYERTFGSGARERGRWVQDPVTGELYRAGEQRPSTNAQHAPVMVDRYLENTCATDGTDISTRAKREDYMRRNGLADPRDFKEHLVKKTEERARFYGTGHATASSELAAKRATEAALGRIVEQRQSDYDRERARREKAREQRGRGFNV